MGLRRRAAPLRPRREPILTDDGAPADMEPALSVMLCAWARNRPC
jgi:hypothetical protein